MKSRVEVFVLRKREKRDPSVLFLSTIITPFSADTEQRMQSSTSSHTAVIPESSITYRTVTAVQPPVDPEQRWKFYLADIPAPVTSRLTSFGVFYIFIGLLSIGLEVGLWENDLFV